MLWGEDNPRARQSDPITSHEAAELSETAWSRRFVLDLFHEYGAMADWQLCRKAGKKTHGTMLRRYSDERLRTARHELAERLIIRDTGRYIKSPRGRRSKVWALA